MVKFFSICLVVLLLCSCHSRRKEIARIVEEWKNKVLFPHIAKYVKDNDIFRKWIYDVLLIYPPVPQNEMDEANQLKRQKEL